MQHRVEGLRHFVGDGRGGLQRGVGRPGVVIPKHKLGDDGRDEGPHSKAEVQSLHVRPSLAAPYVQNEDVSTCRGRHRELLLVLRVMGQGKLRLEVNHPN